MWFNSIPSDLSFIDSAPHRIAAVAEIPTTPQKVFDIFATSDHQHVWMPDFVACRWTSAEPHGVGATREIQLKALTARERFLIWEPGKRLTFSIDATTVPVTAQSVEDMRFEPIGDGSSTRLVWHVFYTPTRAILPLHPVVRAVFGHMFRSSAKNLADWVRSRG
jgi:uncharacterized protein YndB with AHSA1/START domain